MRVAMATADSDRQVSLQDANAREDKCEWNHFHELILVRFSLRDTEARLASAEKERDACAAQVTQLKIDLSRDVER